MKYPALLLTLVISLLATVTLAVEPVTLDPVQQATVLHELPWYHTSPTFLTSASTTDEVDKITAACSARVKAILLQLAAARTERETGILIRKIHQMERDRDLDILALYIHRAEASGQYGWAQELKEQRNRVWRSGRGLEIAASN